MKKLTYSKIAVAMVLVSLSSCEKYTKDTEVLPEELACTTIIDNLTLTDRGSSPDYIIPCKISVEGRLTIEPGVEIVFKADAGLDFKSAGVLDAQGTPAKPIIMRGESSTAGFWRGLRFTSSNNSNKMHFTTVDGGGGLAWDGANVKANISLSGNSKLEIKNSSIINSASDGVHAASGNFDALAGFDGNTFSGNDNYPLRVSAYHVKDLGFNTFTTNGKNKIEVHTARLSNGIIGDQSWTNPGAPILIDDRLDIGGGSNSNTGTLTIGEGVVLEVGSDQSIVVNGNNCYLKTNGTSANPVIIKSEDDSKDYWRGIMINSNDAGNVFNYTQISGAGSASHNGFPGKDCVRLGSNSSGPYRLTMNNCTVSNSSFCGVRYSSNANTATFTDNNTTYLDLGESFCNF
jgi:hypothetical protein